VGFYSNVIFPRFYDCVMDKPFWTKYRQQQLANVSGEILEIGVGTGLNREHYPEHVHRITTVDPNPGMNRMLQKRIGKSGVEVDKRVISSEELPFDDDSFDTIVSTMTLCSIPDVQQAMGELYRVLRPGGRFYFLEHGLSDDPEVQKWQRRLTWLQSKFADGCRLEIDIGGLFLQQPFEAVDMDNFCIEQVAKTQGYLYRGTATK